ncbi:PucR family transcriptional regulator [Blastococcus brunescens]|uniref:Helix-turn-helix domain-containing protein n=1 Tax=Blastococcus brunescens TaxID=1564165 RepID=A0ABZ1B3R0_9ACTN|nr:helix-turn-helix domain-containing protein [Blastococcus sp. BMG 8361]WRL65442.1 helix-turn-helix domain-containing protein [Blastococcus sp. BMG 8361]
MVPLDEHLSHVREQQMRLLHALAQQREPDDEDLARAALLGRRRAGQGLPVQAVIGAYHVGNRELWDRLRSVRGPGEQLLPDVAALMWRSVQLITARLAEAHAEFTRALHADQLTLRHRFLALLQAEVADEEATQIAHALGFDPVGTFLAVCSHAVASDNDGLSALRSALEALSGTAITVRSGDTIVVIAQDVVESALLSTIARIRPGAVLATGLARPSLAGASRSLRDAQGVLASNGPDPGIRRFEDHWLKAVLSSSHELRALVEPQLDVVRAHPHLAEAVLAFASNDLSATGAARSLGLHPNSTIYRLARWQALTGWDPRSFSGLSISLLACWLA